MANILQNISQKRLDQTIKLIDIKHAASLAWLSIYPGKTMYYNGTGVAGHDLSHAPRFNIYYVERSPKGKATVKWGFCIYSTSGTTPDSWMVTKFASTNTTVSKISWGENVAPSSIYPTLKMGKEKGKIIIEPYLFVSRSTMNANENASNDYQSTLARKAFKCKMAVPQPSVYSDSATNGWYFFSIVIFTPKDGLFSSTPPSNS